MALSERQKTILAYMIEHDEMIVVAELSKTVHSLTTKISCVNLKINPRTFQSLCENGMIEFDREVRYTRKYYRYTKRALANVL